MSHRRNSKYEDCLSGDNALLLEEVYTSYTGGNADLPSGWEELFSSVSQRNSFEVQGSAEVVKSSNVTEGDPLYEVSNILNFFRHYGHLSADLDPLKMTSKVTPDYEHYIASIDPRRDGSICGKTGLSLPSVLKKLHEVYCGKIGFEFMHIHSHEERYWPTG